MYIKNKSGFISRLLLSNVLKLFINQADLIITPSASLTDKIKREYKVDNIKTIPHGVNLKNNLAGESFINKRIKQFVITEPKIISVCRLDRQKNIELILNSLVIVKKIVPNFKYYILGKGNLKYQLTELSRKLGIHRNVLILGWKNDVYQYLSKSDLFIFSSNYEAFGIAIIEAMSMGLPVIATDTPYGPREILDNGRYGILFS